MAKNKTITVQQIDIVLYEKNEGDYISLTDTARYRDAERSDYILQNWMRNRSTIKFTGLWSSFITRLLIPSNSMELRTCRDVIDTAGLSQSERLIQLDRAAITQMKSLLENNSVKKLK